MNMHKKDNKQPKYDFVKPHICQKLLKAWNLQIHIGHFEREFRQNCGYTYQKIFSYPILSHKIPHAIELVCTKRPITANKQPKHYFVNSSDFSKTYQKLEIYKSILGI